MSTCAADLIDEVRLVFHRFVQLIDELHAELGVTGPERGVMEYLDGNGQATVPDIARARLVTRQHIQSTMNDLVAAGLAEPSLNPAHRRSPLFDLTERGRATVAGILDRERRYLDRRLVGIAEADIQRATKTLSALREAL